MPINLAGINQKEKRKLIESCIDKIKEHDVIIDLFDEYGIDLDEIHYIPICFADLDVSARTDKGCIYLNRTIDKNEIDHYLVHEICHWAQQTTGNKPTQGANDGDYLENKYEIEGFQNQVEYIADTRSDDDAEEYVDQVLDHHDVDSGREDKKDELMESIARLKCFELMKV